MRGERGRRGPGAKKRHLLSTFDTKHDQFAKTGSGQTQEKHSKKCRFFCQVEVALESFRPNGEETLQKNPVKKKFHPRHEETIKKDPECKRKLAKWWAAHMKGRAPGDVSGTMVRTDTKRPFLFFLSTRDLLMINESACHHTQPRDEQKRGQLCDKEASSSVCVFSFSFPFLRRLTKRRSSSWLRRSA